MGFSAAYTLPKADFSLASLQAAQQAMMDTREVEVQKQDEADAARDATVVTEWVFYNAILDVME